MKKVLVVDDNKTILRMLKNQFDLYSDIEAIYVDSYKKAMKILRENGGKIHAALFDLNLPDAPNGEIVQLVDSHNIPSVVLTASVDENVKKFIRKKDILAYIIKDKLQSINLAVKFVRRAIRNYDTTVMVVDDSKLYRRVLSDILKKVNINVIEASDGLEALEIINNSKEKISLVFTDYIMPIVDGMELTIKIRETFDKDELSIIGISSTDEEDVANDFLKFGANDYITKPFSVSEVITRTNANLELLDLFTKIKDMANKDFLTGAYNRRYFFDSGEAIFLKAKRKEKPIAVAMIDIDNFKNINDTYGHDVGDIAIKEIKKILDKNLRASDLMARFGGEEFCIVLEDISEEDVKKLFEKIRKDFEHNVIDANTAEIKYTVSFGIAYGLLDSLEDMVILSDAALYESKENGRNKVTIKNS
jgi:diguanylate cyclase (GGDEF)-like protein